jgi:hypothetical protein
VQRVGRVLVVVWICKLERRFLPQRVLRHLYLHQAQLAITRTKSPVTVNSLLLIFLIHC